MFTAGRMEPQWFEVDDLDRVIHYSLPTSEGDIVTGWIEPDGTIRMWSSHHRGTITVDADAFGAKADPQERELVEYHARQLGVAIPPEFGTWGKAAIQHIKNFGFCGLLDRLFSTSFWRRRLTAVHKKHSVQPERPGSPPIPPD